MSLSPTQRKAALEDFRKHYVLSADWTEEIILNYDALTDAWKHWLASWQMATQTAYERAAVTYEQCGPIGFFAEPATAIRDLAKETSGSDKDPQASDEGEQP